MKTKSYLIGLLCAVALAGLFAFSGHRLIADSPASLPNATIILGYIPVLGPVRQSPQGGWYNPQVDLIVEWTSCSSGCPEGLIGKPLAEAINICRNAGFNIGHKSAPLEQPSVPFYLLTRP